MILETLTKFSTKDTAKPMRDPPPLRLKYPNSSSCQARVVNRDRRHSLSGILVQFAEKEIFSVQRKSRAILERNA